MNIDGLKEKIKPELESIFGSSMTNLILNKAKIRVSSDKAADEHTRCRTYIECLANDERVVGMWGNLEVKDRLSKWMNYL